MQHLSHCWFGIQQGTQSVKILLKQLQKCLLTDLKEPSRTCVMNTETCQSNKCNNNSINKQVRMCYGSGTGGRCCTR